MATITALPPLRVKDPVVALLAQRGVPVGTNGTVIHVQGLTWTRYWVLFDNGLRIGTIDRSKLATPQEWGDRNAAPTASDATALSTGEAAAEAGDTVASVGGVPGHLLERSRLARERLGAKKP